METTLKAQIEFMELANGVMVNAMTMSIIESLKELRAIKEKQLLALKEKYPPKKKF